MKKVKACRCSGTMNFKPLTQLIAQQERIYKLQPCVLIIFIENEVSLRCWWPICNTAKSCNKIQRSQNTGESVSRIGFKRVTGEMTWNTGVPVKYGRSGSLRLGQARGRGVGPKSQNTVTLYSQMLQNIRKTTLCAITSSRGWFCSV